jgi:hypothetical protein
MPQSALLCLPSWCHPSPAVYASSRLLRANGAAQPGKFSLPSAGFESDKGQSDPAVRYLSRGRGQSFHVNRGTFGYTFLFQPVAVAADVDDRRAIQQA